MPKFLLPDCWLFACAASYQGIGARLSTTNPWKQVYTPSPLAREDQDAGEPQRGFQPSKYPHPNPPPSRGRRKEAVGAAIRLILAPKPHRGEMRLLRFPPNTLSFTHAIRPVVRRSASCGIAATNTSSMRSASTNAISART